MRRISHLTDLRTLLDPWLMENHKPSQSFLELHGEMKVQIFSLFKGQGLTEDSLKECQANRSFKQFPKEEMTILTQVWFNGSIKSSSVVFPSISLLDCICHQTQGCVFYFFTGHGFLCYLCAFMAISVWLLTLTSRRYVSVHCVARGPNGVQSSWTQMCSSHLCPCPCHTLCKTVKGLAHTYRIASLPFGNSPVAGSTHFLIGTLSGQACSIHLHICTLSSSQSRVEKWVLLPLQRLVRHMPCISIFCRHRRLCIIFHFSIYMPLIIGKLLSTGDCCIFEWLLVSLSYFNIS